VERHHRLAGRVAERRVRHAVAVDAGGLRGLGVGLFDRRAPLLSRWAHTDCSTRDARERHAGLIRCFKNPLAGVQCVRRVSLRTDYPPTRRHRLHQEVVERPDVDRSDLLVWGPVGAATQFAWFDADPEATAALLDAVPAVDERRVVAGDGGTYAFTRQSEFAFDPDLLDVIAAADVAFLPPVSFHGDGTATVDAVGEHQRLAALVEALAAYVDVTVEAVRDFHRGGAPAALTDRQRAALDAADAVGYYEIPREGSVADVAAELGCATSTAGELLRKAEARVVTAVVD
jgi:hypothetical protein